MTPATEWRPSAVQSDARGAAELFILDPAQQVQRLGHAAELGDRASEPAGPAAALEDAQELGRTDGRVD